MVLFRIKHFEQSRCGIATEIHAHFVDLIEQKQRIAHADFGQALHDTPRHRTDVGTTMTTNFGFITHTTQSHTHELAIGRTRNRLTKRGFTHTRRTDQTQNRRFVLRHALLNSKILQHALFDLFKTVVVFIQNLFSFGNVFVRLGAF